MLNSQRAEITGSRIKGLCGVFKYFCTFVIIGAVVGNFDFEVLVCPCLLGAKEGLSMLRDRSRSVAA